MRDARRQEREEKFVFSSLIATSRTTALLWERVLYRRWKPLLDRRCVIMGTVIWSVLPGVPVKRTAQPSSSRCPERILPTFLAIKATDATRRFSPEEAGRGDCRGFRIAGLLAVALSLRRIGGFCSVRPFGREQSRISKHLVCKVCANARRFFSKRPAVTFA